VSSRLAFAFSVLVVGAAALALALFIRSVSTARWHRSGERLPPVLEPGEELALPEPARTMEEPPPVPLREAPRAASRRPEARAEHYAGRVLTLAREPVAGVRVALLANKHLPGAPERRITWYDRTALHVLRVTHTDATGRFRIDAGGIEQRGVTLYVAADAPEGFVPERLANPPRGGELEIVLRPGGAVTGVVRAEETGDPIPGAQVRIRSRVVGAEGFEDDEDHAMTDDDGAYRVDHFVGEVLEFAVRLQSLSEFQTLAVERAPIGGGEVVRQDLYVRVSPYVAGRVIDGGTGAPIDGATIASMPQLAKSCTTRGGRFLLSSIRVEEGSPSVRLSVTHDDYLDAVLALDPLAPESRNLTIAMRRATVVSGFVCDAGGRPWRAEVTISWRGRVLASGASQESDGAFSLRKLPPIARATIVARTARDPGLSALLADLDLRADRAGILLRVADPRTAAVSVEVVDPPPSQPLRVKWRRIDSAVENLGELRGIGPGACRIDGLEAGSYWISGPSPWHRGARVDLGPGDHASVVLAPATGGEPPDAIAWISGFVYRRGRVPRSDFVVSSHPEGRLLSPAQCPWLEGRAGRFEMELPAGLPVTITVRVASELESSKTLTLGPFAYEKLEFTVHER
jgi:hypothetical protein